MNSYVQLTLSEYDELKQVQVEATTLVEQTNKNLSRKLTEANEKITELESDLRKYAIGNARMRPELEIAPERDMPPMSEIKHIIELIADDETSTQTRGSAKLGRSPWSADDDHTIINSEGELVLKLASELSRTEAAIRSRASHLGCKVKHKKIVKKT